MRILSQPGVLCFNVRCNFGTKGGPERAASRLGKKGTFSWGGTTVVSKHLKRLACQQFKRNLKILLKNLIGFRQAGRLESLLSILCGHFQYFLLRGFNFNVVSRPTEWLTEWPTAPIRTRQFSQQRPLFVHCAQCRRGVGLQLSDNEKHSN